MAEMLDANLLARIAQGPRSAEQEAALEDLIQNCIGPIAKAVAKRFQNVDRDGCLEQDLVRIIAVKKLPHFDWRKGSFRCWCMQVATNIARDLARQFQRERKREKTGVHADEVAVIPAGSDWDAEDISGMMQLFGERLRPIVEAVRKADFGRARVNYRAVLQLEMRRRMWYVSPIDTRIRGLSANQIELWLPWTPADAEGCVSNIRIDHWWGRTKKDLSEGEPAISAVQLTGFNGNPTPADIRRAHNLYHQWVSRAVDTVRSDIGPNKWDKVVRPWFNKHQGRNSNNVAEPSTDLNVSVNMGA